MKKLLIYVSAFGFFFVSLAIPAVTQATSLSSTQTQAIISLLQSFGVDNSTIANVEMSLGVTPSTSSSVSSTASVSSDSATNPPEACLTLPTNLYLGLRDSATDDSVSQLQKFLGMNTVTGYYGPLTLQAVQNWQTSHSVVSSGSPSTTGYGVVGPQTRARMDCADSSSNSMVASTSPICPINYSGTYPNCVSKPVPTPLPPPVMPVAIDSLSVTQAAVGTQITIKGSGFTQNNIVHFDIGGTTQIPSSNDGTLINYTIPSSVSVCDLVIQTTKVSCLSVTRSVEPGVYTMYVSNENGQTSSVDFTVLPSKVTYPPLTTLPPTLNINIMLNSGSTSVTQGDGLPVSWQTQNAPSGSQIALWRVDSTGKSTLLAYEEPSTGDSTLSVPQDGSPLPVCATIQEPNTWPSGCWQGYWPAGNYTISAKLYQSNGSMMPSSYLATATSSAFTVVSNPFKFKIINPTNLPPTTTYSSY